MSARPGSPEAPIRERAFVALLLLVGGGAVGVGLFQTLAAGGASLSGTLDLCLGAAVLLVTWLFLAPAALPSYFGDPAPGTPPVVRPYLPAAIPTPAPVGSPSLRAHPRPDPIIPKWADPLVAPRRAAPIPAAVAAPAELEADSRQLPLFPTEPSDPPAPSEAPSPRRPPEPRPSLAPEPREPPVPVERPRRAPPPRILLDPDPPAAADWRRGYSEDRGSSDILLELDRIEAELRTFVPIVPESAAAGPDADLDLRGSLSRP